MSHYRKSHVKNKISKITPKTPFFLKLWFWLLFLLAVLLSTAVYFLFFYQGFQISNIEISGNEKLQTDDIKSFVNQSANQKLFGLGPLVLRTRSILLVDQGRVSREVSKNFPIIEKISVQKKYPNSILLGITERKPVGVLCDNSNQNCMLIDDNGVVFEDAGDFSGVKISRLVPDLQSIFAGEDVINRNLMEGIIKAKKMLQDNYKIDVAEASVTGLRLNVATSEGWKVYFNADPEESMDLQIAKLNLLLQSEITPEQRQKLQYIDLRFKGRAYYK